MQQQLTLVEGGRPANSTRATDIERLIDPAAARDAAATLARVMHSSPDRNDLRSFMTTWGELGAFAVKLTRTLTEYVPGVNPQKSLLQEAMEAACFGYLSAGPTAPPGLDVARFFGGGLAIAARGLCALSIAGHDAPGRTIRWDPKKGGLSQFVDEHGIARLSFRLRAPASPAERLAMRNFLVQSTMEFEDDVKMVRAGVDYKTFEPF